jgi:amidase
MDTYHRWMECTLYATFADLPAASVPAGFHANGRWPMGLQLMGAPLGDAALLRLCAAYEHTCPALLARRPDDSGVCPNGQGPAPQPQSRTIAQPPRTP